MGGKSKERLFMWAGGKSRMIPHYEPHLTPAITGLSYVEPFAGGAALFQHLNSSGEIAATLSDVNKEIMDLYCLVKADPEFLIDQMNIYDAQWMPLNGGERKAHYYELRQTYWNMPEGKHATALLYFLMKTGFNGIWQTCKASKGRYGTPVGLANQKVSTFSPTIILEWHKRLRNTDLLCDPYQDVPITQKSFIFCDPPYRDSFTTYGTDFDDDGQRDLIEWCREQNRKTGSVVWLCNRDAGDGFFDKHAPDAKQLRFPITYTAGRRKQTADGFEAKKAVELLLIWE